MSEIDPRGGSAFSNMSEIQKSLKYPIGGGVKPIWDIVPNFPIFELRQAGAELCQAHGKLKLFWP